MRKEKKYKPIIVPLEVYKKMVAIFGPSAGKCDVQITDTEVKEKDVRED